MAPNPKKFDNRSSHAKSNQSGLSLTAFAKAKKNSYDPRVIKEKERIRAAKTVNKYKKLKQRLQATATAPSSQIATLGDDELNSDEEQHNVLKDNKKHNKHNDKQTDINAEAAAKKELEERRNAAMKKRKTEKKLFKKTTRHGQPLMKYRIEKMLDKLENIS